MNTSTDVHAWEALRTLAYWYCNTSFADFMFVDGVYYPTERDDEELLHFVREQSYKVLAHALDVPEEYLTKSQYPSPEYAFDKRVYLHSVGFVRFILYPRRKAPGGNGFLRLYVQCPACGKKCAVGRFRQHIGAHEKDALLLERYNVSSLDIGTRKHTNVIRSYYRLKWWVHVPGKSSWQVTRFVHIDEERDGYALAYVKDRDGNRVQLDVVGEDADDTLAQIIERVRK